MIRPDNIRKEILMQLYAARPLSISAERIARDARKAGYDFTAHEILNELIFLQDKGLVVSLNNSIGSELIFRIHALGVTYYEQELQ